MIGGAGTPIWAGNITDQDPNTRVRGNWLDTETGKWGTARSMMLDAYVRQAVEGVTDAIYAADHDFDPGDDSPLAAEIADFCRFQFFECNSFTSLLEKALYYFRDGVSLAEVTDDIRPVPRDRFPNHPGRGMGLVYTGFHQRSASTINRTNGWIQSESDPTKLLAVKQYIGGSDAESAGYRTISARNLIRWTWMQEGADFRGFAPLRAAYGAWFRKVVLVKVAMIAHERHHVGVPTIVWDAAAQIPDDELEKIEETLLELRAHHKAFLSLPPGADIEFKSAAGGTDIEAAIREANLEITHAFAGGWQLLGSGGGNGSYALAGTQQGRTHVVTDRHVDFLDDVFNFGSDGWSVIERIVRANYGPDAPLPKKVTRNVPTVDYLKIAETLPSLISANVIIPDDKIESQVRRWARLGERDEATIRGGTERLNGAQLAEERNILQAVIGADGLMPRESAVEFIVQNFGIDRAVAERIVPTGPAEHPNKTQAPGVEEVAEEEDPQDAAE